MCELPAICITLKYCSFVAKKSSEQSDEADNLRIFDWG